MPKFGLGELLLMGIPILLGVLALILLSGIFYLLTLARALRRCSPEVRTMSPGLVWLQLIPGFNLIWHFFVVVNVGKSLGAELERRGVPHEPRPGQSIGLAMCILACGIILPFLGILSGIGWLICWLAYWATIARASGQLVDSTIATRASGPTTPTSPAASLSPVPQLATDSTYVVKRHSSAGVSPAVGALVIVLVLALAGGAWWALGKPHTGELAMLVPENSMVSVRAQSGQGEPVILGLPNGYRSRFASGDYMVSVTAEGFEPWDSVVKVKSGDRLAVTPRLTNRVVIVAARKPMKNRSAESEPMNSAPPARSTQESEPAEPAPPTQAKAGIGAPVPSGDQWTTDHIAIPSNRPDRVVTKILAAGKRYRIVVSGTFDPWGETNHNVDALGCFGGGRCSGKEAKLSQELRIDGRGLRDWNGGNLSPSPDHRYEILVVGAGRPLTLYIRDSVDRGSWQDNVGSLEADITSE